MSEKTEVVVETKNDEEKTGEKRKLEEVVDTNEEENKKQKLEEIIEKADNKITCKGCQGVFEIKKTKRGKKKEKDICSECTKSEKVCPDKLACVRNVSCTCGRKGCQKCISACQHCSKLTCGICESGTCMLCQTKMCNAENCKPLMNMCSSGKVHDGGFCKSCGGGKSCDTCSQFFCVDCIHEHNNGKNYCSDCEEEGGFERDSESDEYADEQDEE
jgi:hypothetical protein